MNVTILSREDAEKLLESGFPQNVAVISFYDPPPERSGIISKPLDYSAVTSRVFAIPVHDIDVEVLKDFGLTVDTYFPEVDKLAEFILKAKEDGLDVICQCEYGQSRSAACAAAIREYFTGDGINIFSDYRYYPNQLVYNKIINALRLAR